MAIAGGLNGESKMKIKKFNKKEDYERIVKFLTAQYKTNKNMVCWLPERFDDLIFRIDTLYHDERGLERSSDYIYIFEDNDEIVGVVLPDGDSFNSCIKNGYENIFGQMLDLSEKELQNIKTALAYENYIFPWLEEGVSHMTAKIKESKQREYNSLLAASDKYDAELYVPSYYKPNNYTQQYNYSNYAIPRSYNNYKSNYSNPFNTYSSYLKNLRYQQQQAEYAKQRQEWEDN